MTVTTDDPTIKMLRSGFGKQIKTPHSSNPAYGFGSSHRDAFMKVRLVRSRQRAGASL
jgi:hypothetical protein